MRTTARLMKTGQYTTSISCDDEGITIVIVDDDGAWSMWSADSPRETATLLSRSLVRDRTIAGDVKFSSKGSTVHVDFGGGWMNAFPRSVFFSIVKTLRSM